MVCGMKRLLPWILNIVLMFALAIGVSLYLEDDSPSNAAAPKVTTTTTTAPAATAFISAGPHAKELRETLAELPDEIDLSEWDPDDWELSYVTSVAEKDDLLVVVTGETIEALYPSTSCNGDEDLPKGYFRAIFGKGDWVLWETKGDDPRICPGEIILAREN